MSDYKKRREQQRERAEEREEMIMDARLLDLEKAYPRVNKPCLWGMLKRCGLEGPFRRTIEDLHETTMHKVKVEKSGAANPGTRR